MKWRKYDGQRISAAGKRTCVEEPPPFRFAEPVRRHGYVWHEGNAFEGFYEVLKPGEIEDVRIGPFASEREAKAAIERELLRSAGAGTVQRT